MISNLTEKTIIGLINDGVRKDGRTLEGARVPKITTGYVENAAGSALVELGKTKVIVGVKIKLGEPFQDRPEDGMLATVAELSPMASPLFESGPPDPASVELARVVDRVIRESEMIELKKLCIKAGEKVWDTSIDIYVLDMDGNLFDAGTLGAAAALLTAKMPKYDSETDTVIYEETTGPMPLSCRPVSFTFAKIGKKIVLDPTVLEEKLMSARFTVGLRDDGTICAMQKGGIGDFLPEEIEAMLALALKKAGERRELLPASP